MHRSMELLKTRQLLFHGAALVGLGVSDTFIEARGVMILEPRQSTRSASISPATLRKLADTD